MKLKKTCFSTKLSDLYGIDNYQNHIEVNREYWYYFFGDCDICNTYGTGWYKIKVTYIRSKCMFYIFSDYPDMPEQFCPINCFLASCLVFAEIDPLKDLKNEMSKNIDYNKIKYCFDDKHTIVKNWDNERYIEIDENELEKILNDNSINYIDILIREVKDE